MHGHRTAQTNSNTESRTQLLQAISQGDLTTVSRLLTADPTLIRPEIPAETEGSRDPRPKFMDSPIHVAAKNDKSKNVLSYLLEQDPTLLNEKARNGITPLMVAVSYRSEEICNLLLQQEQINVSDVAEDSENTLLHFALTQQPIAWGDKRNEINFQIVQSLMTHYRLLSEKQCQHGHDDNSYEEILKTANKSNDTPLTYGCKYLDAQYLENFLALAGQGVNAICVKPYTVNISLQIKNLTTSPETRIESSRFWSKLYYLDNSLTLNFTPATGSQSSLCVIRFNFPILHDSIEKKQDIIRNSILSLISPSDTDTFGITPDSVEIVFNDVAPANQHMTPLRVAALANNAHNVSRFILLGAKEELTRIDSELPLIHEIAAMGKGPMFRFLFASQFPWHNKAGVTLAHSASLSLWDKQGLFLKPEENDFITFAFSRSQEHLQGNDLRTAQGLSPLLYVLTKRKGPGFISVYRFLSDIDDPSKSIFDTQEPRKSLLHYMVEAEITWETFKEILGSTHVVKLLTLKEYSDDRKAFIEYLVTKDESQPEQKFKFKIDCLKNIITWMREKAIRANPDAPTVDEQNFFESLSSIVLILLQPDLGFVDTPSFSEIMEQLSKPCSKKPQPITTPIMASPDPTPMAYSAPAVSSARPGDEFKAYRPLETPASGGASGGFGVSPASESTYRSSLTTYSMHQSPRPSAPDLDDCKYE